MQVSKLTALIIATSIVSCGGDSTKTPEEILAGRWTGVLTLTEVQPVTCAADATLSQTHNVSVSDRVVVLDNAVGLRHEGTLHADNEFDARFLAVGAQVEFIQTISYRNVADDRGDVTITNTQRTFNQSCALKWAGTMTRVTADSAK